VGAAKIAHENMHLKFQLQLLISLISRMRKVLVISSLYVCDCVFTHRISYVCVCVYFLTGMGLLRGHFSNLFLIRRCLHGYTGCSTQTMILLKVLSQQV